MWEVDRWWRVGEEEGGSGVQTAGRGHWKTGAGAGRDEEGGAGRECAALG